MGKYRLPGQITILASLALGVTAVLAVVCVRSVIVNMSLIRANESVNLGVESVFSEYLEPLFEKYEVFGFQCDGKKGFEAKLSEYMSYNLDCEKELPLWRTTFVKLKEKEINIKRLAKLTDGDGKIFAKQITDYMKYAVPVEVIEKWLGVTKDVGDTEAAQEVFEEYTQVVEYAAQIDEKVMEIVQKIDTVLGNHVLENMKRLDTELILINLAYYSPQSMGVIKSDGFYGILYEILQEIRQLEKILGGFEKDFEIIHQLCERLKEKSQQAVAKLHKKKDRLSTELYNAYEESYREYEDYEGKKSVVSSEQILKAASENLSVLKNAYEIEELADVKLDIGNLGGVSARIHDFEAVMEEFDYSGFTHQYEGMAYEKSETEGTIKRIKKLLTEGVMSFVLPQNSTVSGKYISYPNLATKTERIKSGSDYLGAVSDVNVAEDILFNEYVIKHFNCYTNVREPAASLQYEIEYVLCGESKDKKNLENVINQIVLVRSGFNLACIMTDAKKRAETEAYSAAVLGFTGSPAIIGLGQCMLMSAWAYGEAINDAGILAQGGKIPLVKTAAGWNTDLMEVITLNFKKGRNETEGLSYEDYLRILLYLSNRKKKYYRTMDLIEIGMEDAGYQNVRLSEVYCGSSGSVIFKINGMEYEQKFEYEY